MTDLMSERRQLAYIAGQAADARLNVELETEGMTLNIGPQHPATHGTLRIVAKLDGEKVINCEPVMGYMHRGYEKLTEVRTYPQVTTLVNRIDWLGSFANEVPFILAAEKLMEIEAPERAQYIRTILFELSRIANIGLQGGTRAELDLGKLMARRGAVLSTGLRARPPAEKAAVVASVREHVWPHLEAGRVRPVVDRVLPMADAAEGHRVVEASSHVGKVLLST